MKYQRLLSVLQESQKGNLFRVLVLFFVIISLGFISPFQPTCNLNLQKAYQPSGYGYYNSSLGAFEHSMELGAMDFLMEVNSCNFVKRSGKIKMSGRFYYIFKRDSTTLKKSIPYVTIFKGTERDGLLYVIDTVQQVMSNGAFNFKTKLLPSETLYFESVGMRQHCLKLNEL